MAWPRNRLGRSRNGSLIIEAVISVALLATATYALARLAQSAAALNQQADQRLAARLTVENVIERMRDVPFDELAGRADELADVASRDSGCDVRITSERFNTGGLEGIHLRVEASPSEYQRVTLHDWRLGSSGDAGNEPRAGDSEGDDDDS